jgi:hypothetical protein
MKRMMGRAALLSLFLVCLSAGVAQAQGGRSPWDTCLKAPVLACVLDEALALALPVEGNSRRATLLGRIAETWAKGGEIDQALRVVTLIPSQFSRASAFVAVGEAQAKAGRFEQRFNSHIP